MKRHIQWLLLLMTIVSCSEEKKHLGYDIELWKDTEVWNFASYISNNDFEKAEELLSCNSYDVDFREPKFGETLPSWVFTNKRDVGSWINVHNLVNYRMMGESTGSDAQPYKYNAKEHDRHSGLDWYDYGARWYNGISWMTPDPLAEKYYDISPYVYCLGNPVKFIDPDGRKVVIWYKDTNGTYKSFEFSGLNNQKTIKIPQNQFVKDFITTYSSFFTLFNNF